MGQPMRGQVGLSMAGYMAIIDRHRPQPTLSPHEPPTQGGQSFGPAYSRGLAQAGISPVVPPSPPPQQTPLPIAIGDRRIGT